MPYKRKLIILLFLIVFLTVLELTLPYSYPLVSFYDKYIFLPYQTFRNFIFGFVPISIGDILYVISGLLVIVVIIKWGYFSVKFGTHKHYLAHSFLQTIITLSIIYIFFILGWGANYYKPSLSAYWKLERPQSRVADSIAVLTFDKFLINKLNVYAKNYHALTFQQLDERSQNYYRNYTNSPTKLNGLKVKPSLFGYLMQNLAIQGYYNPFTGESQVNRFLPSFMMPFVICHEMAHQAGIAAEDDANLLAYALGTSVHDTAFNYSCYFNLWLYAHNRLYRIDHKMAEKLELQLNKLTNAQLDTLEDIRRRYIGRLSNYSSELYDEYLRLHQQKDGIRSYGNVSLSAWAWEEKKKTVMSTLISIP